MMQNNRNEQRGFDITEAKESMHELFYLFFPEDFDY